MNSHTQYRSLASGLFFTCVISLSPLNGLANVVGNGTQNFSPVSSLTAFTTVHSSETLGQRHYGLGLFVNHAQNTLPYGKDIEKEHQNSLLGLDVIANIGLTRNLELGFALPFVVAQTINSDRTHSEFAKEGNTEIRSNLKYRVVSSSQFGLALVATLGYDRVAGNPHSGDGTNLSYVFEVVSDYRINAWTLGANLGYRLAPKQEEFDDALVAPDGNQFLTSLGLAYQFRNAHNLVAEVYSRTATTDSRNETNRQDTTPEALFGYRYTHRQMTQFHTGVGTQLNKGFATPSMRLYAGVTHIIAPKPKHVPLQITEQRQERMPREKPRRQRPRRQEPLSPIFPVSEPQQELTDYGIARMEPDHSIIPHRIPDESYTLNNVHFVFDRHDQILRGGMDEIDTLVQHLRSNDIDRVVIEGHTCWMGSDEYNMNLSFRRAQSIKSHLVKKHGFSPEKIVVAGFGKRLPKDDNNSERGRRINRRVEFKVYYLAH